MFILKVIILRRAILTYNIGLRKVRYLLLHIKLY